MKQTYRNEQQLQEAVARYLDSRNLLWFHPANERKTTPQAGARLKRQGVKAGVPDVLIFDTVKARDFDGLAIELKVGTNKTRRTQVEWLKNLNQRGWHTAVCYNLDEVIALVEYFYGK